MAEDVKRKREELHWGALRVKVAHPYTAQVFGGSLGEPGKWRAQRSGCDVQVYGADDHLLARVNARTKALALKEARRHLQLRQERIPEQIETLERRYIEIDEALKG